MEHEIKLVAINHKGCRDGTYGWQLYVDGKLFEEVLRNGDLDVGCEVWARAFKTFGIKLTFDWE